MRTDNPMKYSKSNPTFESANIGDFSHTSRFFSTTKSGQILVSLSLFSYISSFVMIVHLKLPITGQRESAFPIQRKSSFFLLDSSPDTTY